MGSSQSTVTNDEETKTTTMTNDKDNKPTTPTNPIVTKDNDDKQPPPGSSVNTENSDENLVSSTKQNNNRLNHIKKFFIKQNDSDNTLESLNLTEFQPNGSRYGGNNSSLTGGINITDLKFQKNIEKKRYTKYDLFQVLRDIDSDFQKGGGGSEGDVSDDNVSSLNDEKSLQHLKNIILNELENLKKSKLSQSGGSGCGCENPKKQFSMKHVNIIPNSVQEGGGDDSSSDDLDSSSDLESDSSELGKKKKVNKKKVNQKFTLNDDISNSDSDYSSRFIVETSESSIKKSTSNSDNSSYSKKKSKTLKKKSNKKSSPVKSKKSKTSTKSTKSTNSTKSTQSKKSKKSKKNYDDSEGLSIFPFNSSDVKSSLSDKNYRMLRRKI